MQLNARRGAHSGRGLCIVAPKGVFLQARVGSKRRIA